VSRAAPKTKQEKEAQNPDTLSKEQNGDDDVHALGATHMDKRNLRPSGAHFILFLVITPLIFKY